VNAIVPVRAVEGIFIESERERELKIIFFLFEEFTAAVQLLFLVLVI